MLGDVFGKGAMVGTGLVAAGAVLIAVFGVVEEREHSLDELLRLFGRQAFVVFFSIEGFVIIVTLVAVSFSRYLGKCGKGLMVGTFDRLVRSETVERRWY
jgi:ABC-type tungstate transport system substrate-binding protein